MIPPIPQIDGFDPSRIRIPIGLTLLPAIAVLLELAGFLSWRMWKLHRALTKPKKLHRAGWSPMLDRGRK